MVAHIRIGVVRVYRGQHVGSVPFFALEDKFVWMFWTLWQSFKGCSGEESDTVICSCFYLRR